MDVMDALRTRRTIRRFRPDRVPREVLLAMVDCARLAPTAANLQPLRYVLVDDPAVALDLYGLVKLGSYLQGDDVIGKNAAERPGAYIAVLFSETGVSWSRRDIGASVQSMLLAALALGYATCWIANIQRKPLRERLAVPEDYDIDCLVAVGKADESSRPVPLDQSTIYTYERPGLLNVPKRNLTDIVHLNRFGS